MRTMKAWVYDPDQDPEGDTHLYLREKSIPEPGPADVLLKILKVSVCGTDEMLIRGNLKRASKGVTPGHEFCGEIVQLGRGVEQFEVGQIVAGESHYTDNGDEEGVIGLWPPKTKDGTTGRLVDGGYAEYACIPNACAHPIPDQLARGAFWPSLFEPAGNDFLLARVLLDRASPATVGVWGCGPHGIYAQIFLRHFGVQTVIGFETNPYRRDFAREVGAATTVLDPSDPQMRDKLVDYVAGPCFDATVDMVGKSGAAFEQACGLTRPDGTVALFGLFQGDYRIQDRPANDLIFQREEMSFSPEGRRLRLLGVTGREGIWPELIDTVASSQQLQEMLMRPVEIVGPLNLLGEELRKDRPNAMKLAFSAFE